MMFAAFSVAALGGLGLLAVGVRELRHDRAKAVHAAVAGPTRALVAAHHAPAWAIEAGYIGAVPLYADPAGDVLEHVAPGPGSLTTLAQVGVGSLITITHDDLVDPEVAQWFIDALDRPVHIPGRDEAREVDEGGVLTRFHIAMEPAMRQARLWSLRGHAGHGATASRWADLDRWRIDCPTGEYPSLLAEPEYATADMAEALLVS